MTTYNTYQEAKIANPECEIYQLERNGLFAHCDYHKDELVRFVEFDSAGIKCNPADYCMTVEGFLADGCKFNDGDAYLDWKGRVRFVGSTGFTKDACNDIRNIANADQALILRAAALEEKTEGDFWAELESSINEEKPRTKVEYVKCEFESFSDVYSSILSGGEVYGYEVDGYRPRCYLDESGSFIWRYKERCASYSGLKGVDINQLYRRIETPMTEREAFVEALNDLFHSHTMSTSDLFNAIVDSGKFKLVN